MNKLIHYVIKIFSKVRGRVLRNEISIGDKKSQYHRINLEWWSKSINIGDTLADVIYQWMLAQKNCSQDIEKNKTIHLMTLGSVIGMKNFDAVIWGSGIHCLGTLSKVMRQRRYVKYDIRAVRGPITKEILVAFGYDCHNCSYGDPGVLMPLIYPKAAEEKKYDYAVIHHLKNEENNDLSNTAPYHRISVKTNDYKLFIDEIVASKFIISSSLHGIILAESYGVPAIFINESMDQELMKFHDWYYSTGRMSVQVAESLEEALDMVPMELPDLTQMRNNLIKSFPYDLWK